MRKGNVALLDGPAEAGTVETVLSTSTPRSRKASLEHKQARAEPPKGSRRVSGKMSEMIDLLSLVGTGEPPTKPRWPSVLLSDVMHPIAG